MVAGIFPELSPAVIASEMTVEYARDSVIPCPYFIIILFLSILIFFRRTAR